MKKEIVIVLTTSICSLLGTIFLGAIQLNSFQVQKNTKITELKVQYYIDKKKILSDILLTETSKNYQHKKEHSIDPIVTSFETHFNKLENCFTYITKNNTEYLRKKGANLMYELGVIYSKGASSVKTGDIVIKLSEFDAEVNELLRDELDRTNLSLEKIFNES
jgi:hypothetical protein